MLNLSLDFLSKWVRVIDRLFFVVEGQRTV
jgi:hypothetical protein